MRSCIKRAFLFTSFEFSDIFVWLNLWQTAQLQTVFYRFTFNFHFSCRFWLLLIWVLIISVISMLFCNFWVRVCVCMDLRTVVISFMHNKQWHTLRFSSHMILLFTLHSFLTAESRSITFMPLIKSLFLCLCLFTLIFLKNTVYPNVCVSSFISIQQAKYWTFDLQFWDHHFSYLVAQLVASVFGGSQFGCNCKQTLWLYTILYTRI